jgi:hypothetical protein
LKPTFNQLGRKLAPGAKKRPSSKKSAETEQQRAPVMTTLSTVSLSSPAVKRGQPSGLVAEIKSFWREFFARAFNPYRPELHYMRGPGPAWHAKYGPQAAFRVRTDLN